MTIWGRIAAPHTATFYFDTLLLEEEESKASLLGAWKGTAPLPNCWRSERLARLAGGSHDKVVRCYASLSKKKKRAKGARIKTLHQRIQLVEIQLQRDPTDEEVRHILSASQGNLAETLQDQVARNHHLSVTSWFRYGDTCSK
jgi:hypothetical protein